MRARAFFKTKKFTLPGVVIGTEYRPGFEDDLSSWRLVIDDEGNLYQDTEVRRFGQNIVVRQEQVHIGPVAVLDLLLQAEEAGFLGFNPCFDAGTEGQSSCLIFIRFEGADKSVEVRGLEWMKHREWKEFEPEVRKFFDLWQAVHRYAPFRKNV